MLCYHFPIIPINKCLQRKDFHLSPDTLVSRPLTHTPSFVLWLRDIENLPQFKFPQLFSSCHFFPPVSDFPLGLLIHPQLARSASTTAEGTWACCLSFLSQVHLTSAPWHCLSICRLLPLPLLLPQLTGMRGGGASLLSISLSFHLIANDYIDCWSAECPVSIPREDCLKGFSLFHLPFKDSFSFSLGVCCCN